MTRLSSRPANDAGWPFRLLGDSGADGGSLELRRLPMHVEPLPDEVLLSWVARLAGRFGWPVTVIARTGFGLQDPLKPDWWARPHSRLLERLSARTGIQIDRLRPMTFLDWAPVVRDDEATGRFAGWRHEALAPITRGRGLAVCPECLRADVVPYLRKTWLIGWVATCEVHGCALLDRCPDCRLPLRVQVSGGHRPFHADRCLRCTSELSQARGRLAPEGVLQLSAALTCGKLTGSTDLPGIGHLPWGDVVTLCDVLLATVWRFMEVPERLQVLKHVADSDAYRGRLGSLTLLAWLLDDWPRNVESVGVGEIVRRWLGDEGRYLPSLIGPSRDEVRSSPVAQLFLAGGA